VLDGNVQLKRTVVVLNAKGMRAIVDEILDRIQLTELRRHVQRNLSVLLFITPPKGIR
jgi:ABC-type nitrate/sulfonate/bicarbonate transport system ATPase subunit